MKKAKTVQPTSNTGGSTKPIVSRRCKCCNRDYNQKDVDRIYGKDSMVALLGYCSSQCYTKYLLGFNGG
jgi:hypothetical protein